METKQIAIQDTYSPEVSVCYGCGRLNDRGLQIKSYWDGEEALCTFTPRPEHTAYPGYVYGGLIASLIDCHCTGAAASAAYQAAGRVTGSEPQFRYVTASLKVDYLRPTPINSQLIVRAKIKTLKGRKAVVEADLFAGDKLCARGEVIVVQMPEGLLDKKGQAD